MQQLTGLCSSDCLQWAIPRRQRNPVAQENGQEMLARTRGHLPTPQRKSPESLEILGALFGRGRFILLVKQLINKVFLGSKDL